MTRLLLILPLLAWPAAALAREARLEIPHAGSGHEVHVSPPALVLARDGTPLVAWIARDGHTSRVLVARAGDGALPVRVDPDTAAPDSPHQAPGLAAGPGGEIYVSWSSRKPRPDGVLFASDLQLARSLDGGQSFEPPVRVNEDRPLAHAFEGVAAMPDGTVVVAWIDSREGAGRARTYVARVSAKGTAVEHVGRLDAGETCVCCRVAVTAGADRTAVLWRRVFPGDVRDMVLALSRDGGRSFADPVRVHADGWSIAACPHRGGRLAIDGRGRLHATWYTEGRDGRPRLLYARTSDGRRFAPPRRLDASPGTVPDHVRLAATAAGAVMAAWEDATPVRRRVLVRYAEAGDGAFGPIRPLSAAIKAWGPDIAAAPGGDFWLAWHEERFPHAVTVVQRVRASGVR